MSGYGLGRETDSPALPYRYHAEAGVLRTSSCTGASGWPRLPRSPAQKPDKPDIGRGFPRPDEENDCRARGRNPTLLSDPVSGFCSSSCPLGMCAVEQRANRGSGRDDECQDSRFSPALSRVAVLASCPDRISRGCLGEAITDRCFVSLISELPTHFRTSRQHFPRLNGETRASAYAASHQDGCAIYCECAHGVWDAFPANEPFLGWCRRCAAFTCFA